MIVEKERLRDKLTHFSQAVGVCRSQLYRWNRILKERGMLIPQKPVARSHPKKISLEKWEEVKREWEALGKRATEYIIGKRCGISPSMAGKIKREFLEKPARKRIHGSFSFLPHAAWAVDFMVKRWRGMKIYIMMLIEEYSGKKIDWLCRLKASSDMAIALFQKAKRKTGYLPLLLKHDNGKQFTSKRFQGILEEEKVISLPNPSYWAPYNGRMEWSFRDLKKALRIDDDMGWQEVEDEIEKSVRFLNCKIPREKFYGKTCDDLFCETGLLVQNRELLYGEHLRMKKLLSGKAVEGNSSKIKRIAAEWVLEKHGLCNFRKGHWENVPRKKNVNQFPPQFVS